MNLYIHFPFCRRKCSYCALHSRPGATEAERAEYVSRLAVQLKERLSALDTQLATVYFGGGSPALCNLATLFDILSSHIADTTEFTVELHPLDVTNDALLALKSGGVNRISMGIQSLDDAVLSAMGRGYTFAEAEMAFMLAREKFENAGIDLIVGYPGETSALTPRHARLAKWSLAHCSAYSLILEEKTALAALLARGRVTMPDDDVVMDRIAILSRFLADLGLKRYEISNYAIPGKECRHNLATWRGEDYIGLGEGAVGRIGLIRTKNGEISETVTPDFDAKERTIFRLRTREGLDASRFPEWRDVLDAHVAHGLLTGKFPIYRLTERGMEVCDSILSDL